MKKIAYLNSEALLFLDPWPETDEEWRQAVFAHPEVVYYSLPDFVAAFNDDWISDQGRIELVEKEKTS